MGNTMVLNVLRFRQANPIEFGEFVASQGLNIEKGSRRNLTHTSWELKLFSQ